MSDDIPAAVAFVTSAGALTALNKVPESENEERRAKNQKPKLRPINSGSVLLKGIFKAAAKSDSGARVKREIEPIQCGIGQKGGPAVVAMTARLAANTGRYSIIKEDATNGFNALKRQAVFDAVGEM